MKATSRVGSAGMHIPFNRCSCNAMVPASSLSAPCWTSPLYQVGDNANAWHARDLDYCWQKDLVSAGSFLCFLWWRCRGPYLRKKGVGCIWSSRRRGYQESYKLHNDHSEFHRKNREWTWWPSCCFSSSILKDYSGNVFFSLEPKIVVTKLPTGHENGQGWPKKDDYSACLAAQWTQAFFLFWHTSSWLFSSNVNVRLEIARC